MSGAGRLVATQLGGTTSPRNDAVWTDCVGRVQVFEVQQALTAARDEADELRVRAETAEAEAERAKQAAALTEEAAAEAFALAGATPRSRASPSAVRRQDVGPRVPLLLLQMRGSGKKPFQGWSVAQMSSCWT